MPLFLLENSGIQENRDQGYQRLLYGINCIDHGKVFAHVCFHNRAVSCDKLTSTRMLGILRQITQKRSGYCRYRHFNREVQISAFEKAACAGMGESATVVRKRSIHEHLLHPGAERMASIVGGSIAEFVPAPHRDICKRASFEDASPL